MIEAIVFVLVIFGDNVGTYGNTTIFGTFKYESKCNETVKQIENKAIKAKCIRAATLIPSN